MISTTFVGRLQDQVAATLRNSPYSPELESVRVSERNADICLDGIVSSFYHKQLATEICRHVTGVKSVENRIEVEYINSTADRSAGWSDC